MLPAQCVSTRERSGTFPLAVTSHLLGIARKFLGRPERINGDEMNNGRLCNEEKKVPLTCTHRRKVEESRGCFPRLTSRQIVRLKRFHIQSFSLPFSMKIFWFASDIPLIRVQRIRSTTIPVSSLVGRNKQGRKALKNMHVFRLPLYTAKKGTRVSASTLSPVTFNTKHAARCRVQSQLLHSLEENN